MGLNEYRNDREQREQQQLMEAASLLQEVLSPIVADIDNSEGFSEPKRSTHYYERYGQEEVSDLSSRAQIMIQGRYALTLEQGEHIQPDSGQEATTLFVGGDELLMDRSQNDLSGPFGIVLFLDNDKSIVDVQAKCFMKDDKSGPAPALMVRDTALKLAEARQAGAIEVVFEK